eukprot:3585436-Rhodomonas_salina.1
MASSIDASKSGRPDQPALRTMHCAKPNEDALLALLGQLVMLNYVTPPEQSSRAAEGVKPQHIGNVSVVYSRGKNVASGCRHL